MLELVADWAGLQAVGIGVLAQRCGKSAALTAWTQGCCAKLQGCTPMGMRSCPSKRAELHIAATRDTKKPDHILIVYCSAGLHTIGKAGLPMALHMLFHTLKVAWSLVLRFCTPATCPPGHASSLLQQAVVTNTDVGCAAVLHTDGKGEPLQSEPKRKKRLSTKEDIKARMAAEAMDMLASGELMSDSVRHSGAASPTSANSSFQQLGSMRVQGSECDSWNLADAQSRRQVPCGLRFRQRRGVRLAQLPTPVPVAMQNQSAGIISLSGSLSCPALYSIELAFWSSVCLIAPVRQKVTDHLPQVAVC